MKTRNKHLKLIKIERREGKRKRSASIVHYLIVNFKHNQGEGNLVPKVGEPIEYPVNKPGKETATATGKVTAVVGGFVAIKTQDGLPIVRVYQGGQLSIPA